MLNKAQESKHAHFGKGLSNTEHGNPNIIDEKNSEDHQHNVHHNARLEKVCELEADGVKKTQLPLWYGHTRQLASIASRLLGAIKLLNDKVLEYAIHAHHEAHVALFPWTEKAMTIEKERGAKSLPPSNGCDSWRSLAQPCFVVQHKCLMCSRQAEL